MDSIRLRFAALRRIAVAAATVGGLLAAASPSHAYVYSSNYLWASWSQGAWTIYNDVWGNPNGNQTLNVDNINSWNIYTNQTGGGVKSYSNIQVDPNTPLSQMSSASAYFSIGSPGGSIYDWIFDMWTGSSTDEIEVYENWTTPTGGWGREIYSNQTIGASTFSQIWQVNDGHNIVMFFRNQQRTSGYEDLLAIMNWCNSHHLLGNSTFATMPFGPEVTSTSGWQSFYVYGYSASWKNISGGGSGI
jgi:hypothetical protein